MTFVEFTNTLLKRHEKKDYLINGCHGVKEAFRWIRKNKWFNIGKIDECLFYEVLRRINNELVEMIISGDEVELPHKMGKLYVEKRNVFVGMKNGKPETSRRINWNDTIRNWFDDKECMDNKVILRYDGNENYVLRYDKRKAMYKNKAFYRFRTNRSLSKKIHKAIVEGKINI